MTVSGVPRENFIFCSPGGHRMWYLKELAVCFETPPSSVPDGSQCGLPPVFPPLSRCPVCICFETFRSHRPGLMIWALPQNLSLGVSVCLVWLRLSSTALGHYSPGPGGSLGGRLHFLFHLSMVRAKPQGSSSKNHREEKVMPWQDTFQSHLEI